MAQFKDISLPAPGATPSSIVYLADLGTPAANGATSVHAAITQPASGTTVVTSAITNPDVPRQLAIIGNQSTCTGNVVIAGTNIFGKAISETLAANGTSKVVSTKAFKTVTSITIPTRGASGDTISVGCDGGLGLAGMVSHDSVLYGLFDGAREATRPNMTAAFSSTAVELNMIFFASGTQSSFDGAKQAKVAILAL